MEINYSTSFLNFLRETKFTSRIANILHSVYENGSWSRNYNFITNSEIDYITFRQDGTISFLPSNKIGSGNHWARSERQNGKPAKVIRKLFTSEGLKYLELKDADFEIFANQYKSTFSDEGYKWELLDSSKIPEVYQMEIYKQDRSGGSLCNSCMNRQSYKFGIYTNCKQLKILILTNKENKLCGRALVWELEYMANHITLMDRIYVYTDFVYDKFLEYAKENKWWRKESYQSYDNKAKFIDDNGNNVLASFRVKTPTDFLDYPYIDTFTYGGDGMLTNILQQGETPYSYVHTNGKRNGETRELSNCSITGRHFLAEDGVLITRGRYNGYTTTIDNVITDYRGNIWYKEDNGVIKIGEKYYDKTSKLLIVINGVFFLRSDKNLVELEGRYYHISDDRLYFNPELYRYELKQASLFA